jgi:hypothetical protein
VNLGYPFLNERTKIVFDAEKIDPRTPWAKENEDTVYEMNESEPLREETCYFLKLRQPCVSVVNGETGEKFTLSYSQDTLPSFVLWKSLASGDYALGVEPATTELDERFAYKTLAPSEKRVFKLRMQME